MHTKVYAVYDLKSKCFGTPFFAVAKGVAIRMFTELVNDGRSMVSKYPADFTLWELGEFDDLKGQLIPPDHAENLGMASEYKRDDPTPLLPGVEFPLKNGLVKPEFEGERKLS